ncbi:cytochrome b5 [Clostridium sp. SHJSY1]|uniref:cytochrome b5 domain-containing protein n=1 Tax=Clostridium sp. SHJSY1 TaxID=2942483 RepID=UPI002874EC16|nr:cytochrome b5 domain-containing protein [Clostridium sp. SHJSY1]MDS0527347.1 cytochrome b5 [Clostridium sp. SHJSY1]
MSIYFDFKTIRELIGNTYCRVEKEFTLEELSKYDGSDGNPVYIAVNGIVYDLSKNKNWVGGKHFGLIAGKDLTSEFNSCHGNMEILDSTPRVGMITYGNEKEQVGVRMVETYDFSPDDWVRYITPLVNDALEEKNGGMNLEHLFQKYIMIGVFVGQGKTLEEATNEVEQWKKAGLSQLLDKTMIVQRD